MKAQGLGQLGKRDEFGVIGRILFFLFRETLKLFIKLLLRPRKGRVGKLDAKEVEEVYRREAASYNRMHHLTTRGQDLEWRRKAGFFVLNYLLNAKAKNIKVLDICTGTGLTIKEMCQILESWRMTDFAITGLDYSEDMLREARKNTYGEQKVNFVRGDATSLTRAKDGFESFSLNSIDLITQMFGIGGVDKPMLNLKEVLKVLKPGGQYFMIDMHRPMKKFCGEWFFGSWIRMPLFEAKVYDEVTIPLVLQRKWAWRDTTPLFYKIKFITYFDEKEVKHFGFKVLNFEYQSERWWFSLPIMPVARITLEKIEITEKEAIHREALLNS